MTEDRRHIPEEKEQQATTLQESFIEYAISYKGEEPRRLTWTANYDEAVRDAAWRNHVHGDDLGPITVVQRYVVMHVSEWVPAEYPEPLEGVDT
jgi:hypothetical protein